MADADVRTPPIRCNRFARYPKTTIVCTIVCGLALLELCSYVVIVLKGHRDLRFQYRYNRVLSGYTVFQNVPDHSFRTSAIKGDPTEPDPILDKNGFLADAPIRRKKPSGVYRIFLVGGSTAFGAGQNVRYHTVHPYPDGLYSYPASIAGRLKRFLEQQNPGVRYEVINAAGFERRIHQSFIQYVQTLSQFHPDLIINLEGMNDVYSLASGTPFEDIESQLPFYVRLYERPHSLLNYSATYYLLSTAFEKWSHRQALQEPGPGASPAAPSSSTQAAGPAAAEPGREAYFRQLPSFRQNAGRLLQIIRQYFAVLKSDRMRSLFVLQPLLHRLKTNKRLSDRERRFAEVMVPARSGANGPLDEHVLLLMYFYDEFLSAAIKGEAKAAGVEYLDANAAIAGLGPEVEFYTDYCHLTSDGNQRLAEILGRAILAGSPPQTSAATRGR